VCYLDEWRATVEAIFDDDQRQYMLLSAATDNGIRVLESQVCGHVLKGLCIMFYYTVKSFLELLPILLGIDGVCAFLSEKLSQDSIKNYFGRLRQHGRANENPTIARFKELSEYTCYKLYLGRQDHRKLSWM